MPSLQDRLFAFFLIKLSNGVEVPQPALGTWLIYDTEAADAVCTAIKMGYRHIDTVQTYGNERGVGEGIRKSGIARDEIFVTSKVAAEHKDYEFSVNGIEETLRKMKLDFIRYCQDKGIVMEAYSPVPHGEALKNEKIVEMAKKYGVSVPQLCIRYNLPLGMIALPKTANPEHMKNNADVEFEISAEDMEVLKDIEQIKDYGEHGFFKENISSSQREYKKGI